MFGFFLQLEGEPPPQSQVFRIILQDCSAFSFVHLPLSLGQASLSLLKKSQSHKCPIKDTDVCGCNIAKIRKSQRSPCLSPCSVAVKSSTAPIYTLSLFFLIGFQHTS
ncbi:hypothetical protein AMECASPLE_031524 [Ameca splendens]|uniref:Uncharacterized protein n=1 Tax=Ameca splendens TaxID=208324 RepID=A0ABV1A3X0_9TELE